MPKGKMSCFVDTNLLVYAIDPQELKKRESIKDCLRQIINHHTLVLSPQSLNELYRVVTEKRDLFPRRDAQELILAWSEFCVGPYDLGVTRQAWRIQDRHGFGWWDCMLLASASLAGCDIFLSEDMKHEHVVDDLTIVSPFKFESASSIFE
jgi:predicted nucleic acid-binding protein